MPRKKAGPTDPTSPGPPGGSITDELEAAIPSIAATGQVPEEPAVRPKTKAKGKKEPEPAGPSPFGPFGRMTRRLAEPYYKALDCECPDELLWILWAEQGGEVLRLYMPDFSDHPVTIFGLSTLLLVSPILAKVGERYAIASARALYIRGTRDGKDDVAPITDIRHAPRTGP